MSSALPLIVLGNIYFISNSSLSAPNSFNQLVPNVIQKSAINSPEPITHVTTVRRDDYTYTPGIGGHKVHKEASKWNDARSICRQEGGDLAIINSEAESKIIVQLYEKSKPHHGSVDDNYVHIGFHDLFGEGQYETVDGRPVSEAGFNEWAKGEPNNQATHSEKCGSIYRDGKLNNLTCHRPYAFVCELPFST